MIVDSPFFHVFQLKAIGNVTGMPVFTLTLTNKHGFHMRAYDDLNSATDYIDLLPLKTVLGNWIQATFKANFMDSSKSGYINVSFKNLNGSQLLQGVKASFRTFYSGAEFVRPKWGLYRAINSASNEFDTELFQQIQIWKRN